jgi:ABC-type transport system substrate-binding protein
LDETGSIAQAQYPGSGIQELVEAQRTAFDPAEREKIINELAVLVYENANFLFLIEPVNVGVLRNNLEWKEVGTQQDHSAYWGIRPLAT